MKKSYELYVCRHVDGYAKLVTNFKAIFFLTTTAGMNQSSTILSAFTYCSRKLKASMPKTIIFFLFTTHTATVVPPSYIPRGYYLYGTTKYILKKKRHHRKKCSKTLHHLWPRPLGSPTTNMQRDFGRGKYEILKFTKRLMVSFRLHTKQGKALTAKRK